MQDFIVLYPPNVNVIEVAEGGQPLWIVSAVSNNVKWLRNDDSLTVDSIANEDLELEDFCFDSEAEAHNMAFHYYAQYNVGGRDVPYPYMEEWAVSTHGVPIDTIELPAEDEDGLEIEYQYADDDERVVYEAEHVKELFFEEFSENYLKFMRDKIGPEADEILWMAFHRGYIIREYDNGV